MAAPAAAHAPPRIPEAGIAPVEERELPSAPPPRSVIDRFGARC